MLVSLLLNGTTLRWLIHKLGLDRLSPQDQGTRRGRRSSLDRGGRETMLDRIAETFDLPPAAAREVAQHYRREIELGSMEFDFDACAFRARPLHHWPGHCWPRASANRFPNTATA
ncbi:hypothetical protein ACU4GD_10310 [Cupriavidus basilensis]